MPRPTFPTFLLAAALLLAGSALLAEDEHRLHLSVGPFDDGPGSSTALIIENRRPQRAFKATRWLWELVATTDGAYYLGPGIYQDVRIGRRLVLTPSMGLGYYEDGGDKNLGHHLQFRLGIELGVELGDDWRAGFFYHHFSNSSISDVNPGAESYLFSLSRPFGRRPRKVTREGPEPPPPADTPSP